jgi:hypothetical protein
MNLATQSLPQDLPRVERARDELGFFSSESVLNILKLILAGTELPDILDHSSLINYTIHTSSILYFQRNTTGAELTSSKY